MPSVMSTTLSPRCSLAAITTASSASISSPPGRVLTSHSPVQSVARTPLSLGEVSTNSQQLLCESHEVHSKLELAHGKVEAKCEICLEDKAEAFCRQCAKFICADCAKSHRKMKTAFPGHMVSTLDELREGRAQDIVIVKEPLFRSCDVHKQPMNVYCFDCKSLICCNCTITAHHDHRYEFVIVAAPGIKQKLFQQLDPLRESRSDMLRAADGIQATVSEVESVAKEIASSFAELRKIIDYHEQELLTETATKVEQKCNLSAQGKGLSIACAAVESVIDYTEHCVERSADDEIMCMHTEIQSRINRAIEEQQK